MADQIIQLPNVGDTTGPKIDSTQLTVGANTVQRERQNIADPANAAGIAGVVVGQPTGTEYGLIVRETPAGGTDTNIVDLLRAILLEIRALKAVAMAPYIESGAADPGDFNPASYSDQFVGEKSLN